MSAGRIVLLVFGILFVLAAFGLLVSGGILMAVDSAFKDNEGYFTTSFQPVDAGSSMIVSEQAKIRMASKWKVYQESPVSIKIEAYNDDSNKPIFIGIARESEMSNYLKDRSYDEITGFDFENSEIELRHHTGTDGSSTPADRNTWVASASGKGEQSLTWDLASGDYNLVIMNADGSSPIKAHVSFGARVAGIIHAVGIGLIIGGAVALIIGGVMIFFAAKGW
jgi:hypothetical protein